MPLWIRKEIQTMLRSPELTDNASIQVVVLVLQNHQGDILITQRKDNQHLAGFWEFPGGKVEANESIEQALLRECLEELSHQSINPRKIMDINHQYPEKRVHLHVFHEQNNHANPSAAEQQNMQWINPSQLTEFNFPPANQAIIDYLLADKT